MPATLGISSDEDAFSVLKHWLDGDELAKVTFDSWPRLNFAVKGGDYDSSINSDQMAAMVDFKMTIGRAFSVLAHGAYDMRRLKQEEEEEIVFTTHLKRGSSIFDTDLTPVVTSLAHAADKYPGISLVGAIVIGLAIVSAPMVLKYFSNRAKELEVEERRRLLHIGLSRQQEAQHALVERATERIEKIHPQFRQALLGAQAAYWKLASASLDADVLKIGKFELHHNDLELLSERRQKRPRKIQEVSGIFSVTGITKDAQRYKVRLESTRLSTVAIFRKPQLTDMRIRLLFSHVHTDSKIRATLEIRVIDKAQVSSRLISFSPVGPEQNE